MCEYKHNIAGKNAYIYICMYDVKMGIFKRNLVYKGSIGDLLVYFAISFLCLSFFV